MIKDAKYKIISSNINSIIFNILNECPEIKEQLIKEYVDNNGGIHAKGLMQSCVFKKFPIFKKYFNETPVGLRETLYCIIKNTNVPKCPFCNNYVPLRNYKVGFQKTCSVKCSINTVKLYKHREKIKHTLRTKYYNLSLQNPLSPLNLDNAISDKDNKNYLILQNYCKHGNVKIYHNTYRKYKADNKIQGSMCLKCNEEIFKTYIPSDKEILNFQKGFAEFYKIHALAMKHSWWIMYYPKYLKIILTYFKKYINDIDYNDIYFPEAYHCFFYIM